MSWDVIKGRDCRMHVVPKDDMRPHRHSVDCWCRPKQDAEDVNVMVHNSMDERERYEQGRPLS